MNNKIIQPKKTSPRQGSKSKTVDSIAEEATISNPLKKQRGRPKKLTVAKEAFEGIVKIGKTFKKGFFSPKAERSLNKKEKEDTLSTYKTLLCQEPKTQHALLTRCFLKELRGANLSKGKMPGIIESHADISYADNEINISGGAFRLIRGNWIQIDLGSKDENEALKTTLEQLGHPTNQKLSKVSLLPSSFLYHFEGLLKILSSINKKKNSSADKKYENQARLISWLSMAYLEIIDEQNQEPPDDLEKPSQRPFRSSSSGLALFKEILLKQAIESQAPEGTPTISNSLITSKVAQSISTKISTKEAVDLACILAEREIEPLKHTYKRETLFKMRAYLTSKFFEESKKHRNEEASPDDKILSQKPRYKTPCVWLVINRHNQRAEVIAIKPTTNVSYWGNPESEKDKYSIIPINQPQSIWDSIDTQAIKQNLVKHQTPITWAVVLFSIASLSLGMFTELPKKENSAPFTQKPPITKTSMTNLGLEKNLEVGEISPNNVGGAYSMQVNKPTKKTITSNSNSVEW